MARRPNDPQRRERILQATLDTIAAHGIHAVTHRKIATCANVPLGSLTYYFSGIEALIEEAFSLFTAEMSAQYQQGFVGVTNREQACDAIADLIFSARDHGAQYGADVPAVRVLQQSAGAEGGDAELDAAQPADVEQWFAPDTARGLDAFIEGMTLHFVTDRAPLSKAAIRMMVGQLAGRGRRKRALKRRFTRNG